MRTIRHLLVFIPLVFLLVAATFPVPKGFVNDFAGVLDQDAKARLEERLTAYERGTSNEIAIAIFSSLAGRPIENFAVSLFEEWKVGKRDKNNGILIVAAIQDRKVRIEVGYGLEGKVPDAQAGRIIREAIAPRFREGKFAEGLEAAVSELINLTGGSPVAGARPPATARPSGSPLSLIPLFVGIVAFALFFAVIRRATRPRCSRCGTGMNLVDDRNVRTSVGLSRSLVYACPKCGYQDHRLQAIPRRGAYGWGTGGFWGGSLGGSGFGGGGGFGGFGGGFSGGGGASGGW